MTRWVGAIGLLGCCGTFPGARAEADDCFPLEPRSASRAAERAGLDEDQERWLLARLVEGSLDSPGDLAGMPGAGGDLIEDLASLFCWEPVWGAGVSAAGKRAGSRIREEIRGHWEGGGMAVLGRRQRRPEDADVSRGAISLEVGRWRGAAGTLAGRYGLGLAVGLPASRGGTAPRLARGEWAPSLSADPDLPRGVVLEARGPRWRGSVFGAEFPDGTRGGTVAGHRDLGEGTAGGLLAVRGDRVAGSLFASHRASDRGRWALEWARSARGSALAGSWALSDGPWRFEAALARRGGGFRSPLASTLAAGGEADAAAELVVGIRRRTPGEGFIRAGIVRTRRPDRDWGRLRRTTEVEVSRPLARRVQAVLLVRTRLDGAEGALPGGVSRERVVRGEIRAQAPAGSWRIRGEERLTEAGGARWVTLSWSGGRDGFRWEFRAARAAVDRGAEGFAWYRRRAGGLYGWDRLDEGAAAGVWGRVTGGRAVWEFSLDGGESGWEGTAGVALALGAGSP